MADDNDKSSDKYDSDSGKPDKMFSLKKWNSVCMWSWDVGKFFLLLIIFKFNKGCDHRIKINLKSFA